MNSRRQTLLAIIKFRGVKGLRELRVCGRHFEDNMYNNSTR